MVGFKVDIPVKVQLSLSAAGMVNTTAISGYILSPYKAGTIQVLVVLANAEVPSSLALTTSLFCVNPKWGYMVARWFPL